MALRNGIQDFALANAIYKGATVTFYTVSGGVKTATKATLYAAPSGTTTLANPQHLGADGKFVQPVYTEVAVIASVTGLTIPDHDTSVIQEVLGTGSSIDLPAVIHAATNKAAPVGADEFGIWDSVTGLLNRVSFTNFFASLIGTAKTTPVDADGVVISDSAVANVSKKLTFANLWVWIQAKLAGATGKTTPVDADTIPLTDSAASNATKTLTWANVKVALKAYFDPLYAAIAGSASQVFSVGTATAAAHAVRLDQINSRIGSEISGWTYANNATDPTNDIDIAAGSGMDSTRAYFISGGALTKQSDVVFSAGTGAGMLDTGVAGNSDYYLWAIARSDTGVVDYLASLSSTAPTMPASYDYKRLIGWFKRVGGTIVAFHTYEDAGGDLGLAWSAPTVDVDLTNTLTTSRRTDAVKVPLNLSVIAELSVFIIDATTGQVIISCPDTTDAAPSATVAPLCNSYAATFGYPTQMRVRTSSTGTIAARSNVASVDAYRVSTVGFTWSRRV